MTWDGQDRRKQERNPDMTGNIERALGRIEQKVDSLHAHITERVNGLHGSVFGQAGIEPRMRAVEMDNAATKAKAGVISLVISTAISGIGLWLGLTGKK